MELIVEFLQILNILSLISTLLDFVPEDALSVKESGLVEFRAVVIDKLPRLILQKERLSTGILLSERSPLERGRRIMR